MDCFWILYTLPLIFVSLQNIRPHTDVYRHFIPCVFPTPCCILTVLFVLRSYDRLNLILTALRRHDNVSIIVDNHMYPRIRCYKCQPSHSMNDIASHHWSPLVRKHICPEIARASLGCPGGTAKWAYVPVPERLRGAWNIFRLRYSRRCLENSVEPEEKLVRIHRVCLNFIPKRRLNAYTSATTMYTKKPRIYPRKPVPFKLVSSLCDSDRL